jgi:4-alpha-glucanotransferase
MKIAIGADRAGFEVSDSVHTGFTAPFPPGYRASGVLLHVTSLPSAFGIGDVGPSAFAWVDRLVAAGQSWWQVLPLGPTGYGHSPYQALSSFAANPLIISPDRLFEEGLLDRKDVSDCNFPSGYVDFERVIPFKRRVLALAWRNFQTGTHPALRLAFEQFCQEKGPVQEDAALFMAIRDRHGGVPFQEWPTELIRREPKTLARVRRELDETIDQFRFGQFIVLRQWQILKQYANERGIRILGDLPIFVSPDSSDVWAAPELFLLDENSKPRVIAGVPPDYFSAEGQLWGNPLYDWEALRHTGYGWWINRFKARLDYLDAIRLDHFRGFEAAWHVPAGAPTAQSGQWVAGPGADFFKSVRQALGGLPLLAEDLGIITPAVRSLRDEFQLPGMRVLQFGFNGDPNNPHLPQQCGHNSVVYTGTHDNDTTRGWYDALSEPERRNFWNCVQRSPGEAQEAVQEMIRLAWSSAAALAVTPLQDLLGLGSAARMNVPGRADGQWCWRWPCDDALNEAAFHRLHELTKASGRLVEKNSNPFNSPGRLV